MFYVRELANYLSENKGKDVDFGDGYEIQVYNSDANQGCIKKSDFNSDFAFLKLEHQYNQQEKLTFCLSAKDNTDVRYGTTVSLSLDEPITNLFNAFAEKDCVFEKLNIESLRHSLISLLQLGSS